KTSEGILRSQSTKLLTGEEKVRYVRSGTTSCSLQNLRAEARRQRKYRVINPSESEDGRCWSFWSDR
ncbi:hypothetical protein CH063_09421, partial [Colletotrichum higginsianum]